MTNDAIPVPADELAELKAQRDELLTTLERIANSVAIGTASKQVHARMRAIFRAIENEARAAIARCQK